MRTPRIMPIFAHGEQCVSAHPHNQGQRLAHGVHDIVIRLFESAAKHRRALYGSAHKFGIYVEHKLREWLRDLAIRLS